MSTTPPYAAVAKPMPRNKITKPLPKSGLPFKAVPPQIRWMRAKAASAKPAPATPPLAQPASVEVSGVTPAGSIPSAEAGQQEEQEAPDWGEDQEMPARSPTPPEEVK